MNDSKKFNPMINESALLRGIVIDSLARLEIKIDAYIARYFCKDEKLVDEFVSTFLKSQSLIIGFKKKIEIFVDLFKKNDDIFYKSLGDVKEELIYINTQRNIFAHHVLDTSHQGLELYNQKGIIQFVQFK